MHAPRGERVARRDALRHAPFNKHLTATAACPWAHIWTALRFGTGKDSVIIRDTSGPSTLPERRRVLGQDAILTARLLFVAVGLALALVAWAGYQVVMPAASPLS
jgi:hypothetical protein